MFTTDSPQVLTRDAADDKVTTKWLGALGNVSGLTYSYTLAGGASQMSCTLWKPTSFRTNAMNPGNIVKIVAGGSIIFDGVLDEPQPSDQGWILSGHGSGTFGDDYMAFFDIWNNNPDDAVNKAIGRGLRWENTGIGSPAGMWLGQRQDPGSQSVTDLLNLVCTRGGLTWYVNSRQSRNHLTVFPLPADPTRLLIASSPVARSLGGDLNVIWVRYQQPSPLKIFFTGPPSPGGPGISSNPDKSASIAAQFKTIAVTDDASIARHGRLETFMDLSSAGPLGRDNAAALAAARQRGNYILERYKRISFAGPFVIGPGQLTNMGGAPVDLACEQPRTMVCKLLLSDYGLGGEVSPAPPQFLVGSYEYSVDAQQATITPMQSVRSDFSSLISEVSTTYGHSVGDWQRR